MTSPYLHDGSEVNLHQTLRRKMGEQGRRDPNHDRVLDQAPQLSDEEIDELVQFMKALTGKHIEISHLARPPSFP